MASWSAAACRKKCHYKEGNLGARRQLDEFARMLEYLGMDAGRVRFVWMDINERGRIQQEIALFEEKLAELGKSPKFTAKTQAGKDGQVSYE